MKCRSSIAILTLVMSAVMGLASPAMAVKQVPLKGRLEGVVTVTPVSPPFIVDVLVSAADETPRARSEDALSGSPCNRVLCPPFIVRFGEASRCSAWISTGVGETWPFVGALSCCQGATPQARSMIGIK